MPNGEDAEYRTSAEDRDFVRPDRLADSLRLYLQVLDVLENDAVFVNLSPRGGPSLGRGGSIRPSGAWNNVSAHGTAVVARPLSDGHHSPLDIAERADMPFAEIREAAQALVSIEAMNVPADSIEIINLIDLSHKRFRLRIFARRSQEQELPRS